MKTLVGTFNQEKAIAGAFSVIIQLQTSRRFVSSSILLPTYLLGLLGGRFPALGEHSLGGLGPHQPLEVDAAAALGRDAQPREGNQESGLGSSVTGVVMGAWHQLMFCYDWGPLFSQIYIYEENQAIYPKKWKIRVKIKLC